MKIPLGRPNWNHCAMNLPFCVEDLEPVVLPVADEQPAARVEGDRVRHVELARAHPRLADRRQRLAAPIEPDDARVADGGAAAHVPVGHEDVAVGRHGHFGRLIELAEARSPATPGLPSDITSVPLGLNLWT